MSVQPAAEMLGPISEGTMRPIDLIPVFMTVLEGLNPGEAERIKSTPDYAGWLGAEDDQDKADYEAGGWILDDLIDSLDASAPEGVYFGTMEGDGACYGFWWCGNEG